MQSTIDTVSGLGRFAVPHSSSAQTTQTQCFPRQRVHPAHVTSERVGRPGATSSTTSCAPLPITQTQSPRHHVHPAHVASERAGRPGATSERKTLRFRSQSEAINDLTRRSFPTKSYTKSYEQETKQASTKQSNGSTDRPSPRQNQASSHSNTRKKQP